MKTMSKSTKKLFIAMACVSMLLTFFVGCKQPNNGGGGATEQEKSTDQQKKPDKPAEPQKSSEKQLLEFKFEKKNNAGLSEDVTGIVTDKTQSVTIEVPNGTDKTKLKASFKISDKAKLFIGKVEQKSGETENNFSNITDGVKYTVKAEDGTTQDYTVKVYIKIRILTFGFKTTDNATLPSNVDNQTENDPNRTVFIGKIKNKNVILMKLPANTPTALLSTLKPFFSVSAGVKLYVGDTELTSGSTQVNFSDLQKGVIINAKASDGGSVSYNAVVEVDLEPALKAEVEKYFCSYYGVLESTYLGKNDVVVVLEENKVTIYSTAMSMDYVNVEWEKKTDGTYTCTTYKKDMPQIKNLYGKGGYDFIEEGSTIKVKTNIMGTPITLTKGENFTWTEGSKYKKITYHI